MKKIEKLLLRGCGFTIAILMLFYIFANVNNRNNANIAFSTFLLILGFGLLISVATLIFEIKSLKLPFRIIIHYVVLLLSFCVVFISTGNIALDSSAKVFSAVIIFTVFYTLFFLVSWGVKKIVTLIDGKLDKHSNSKYGKKSAAESKKPYKKLYSDN